MSSNFGEFPANLSDPGDWGRLDMGNQYSRLDRILEGAQEAGLKAAQCRMQILGFSKTLPGKQFKRLSSTNLERFKRMLLALRIVRRKKTETRAYLKARTIDWETLTLLMDQDSLTAKTAQSVTRDRDGVKFSFVKAARSGRPHGIEVRKFLTRLVQVEFWPPGSAPW